MLRGSCLCGEIQLTVSGPITSIIHCHCSLCRKSSGTAYATNGFVATEHLHIEKGLSFLTHFEMKPGKKRHFCSQCASPVFSSNSTDPERLRIRLGILDTPIEEKPGSHNFVTSKASWDTFEEALPCYEKHEPTR